MATQPRSPAPPEIDYPTGDGQPVGETPVHVNLLLETIYVLRRRFEADPMAYVAGNMFLYYAEGDRRKHVSPDIFVTLGIPDDGRRRDAYFVWLEGKGPDLVIEFTSKSTRREDQGKKLELYRDVLNVREYFLFDPYGEYLKPPLKGFRLVGGQYLPIEPLAGRLPSEVVGLHLQADGEEIRFVDPATGRHLLNPREMPDAFDREKRELIRHAEAERAELARRAEAGRLENERLRREVEELRRRLAGG